MGLPRNLGDLIVSSPFNRLGKPETTPSPRRRARRRGRQEQRAQEGYRCAKATKRGGMGDQESEQLVVPRKRGNSPEGPREGKGLPEHGTTGGNDGGNVRSQHHLNETTADSVAGEAGPGDVCGRGRSVTRPLDVPRARQGRGSLGARARHRTHPTSRSRECCVAPRLGRGSLPPTRRPRS